mmetsp:Transcript_14927/g.42405  ORF Transcript_14927/g.42405 Transcript_14927/m.42405 type:complete len:207 (-) Transcript_14927:279-899(-)
MLAGQVAVKNSVWRCRGILARILRICGSKPMSSILSASSRTSLPTPSSRTCPPSRKSLRRPGQATMVCTPMRYLEIWSLFGEPPYIATHRKPMHWPNRFASSSVCCASSRVGDITSKPGPERSGLTPNFCISANAGSRKANVLPLPVAAIPITSLFCIASGQVYAWICEGPGKPARLSSPRISRGMSRHSSKVAYCCGCTGCSFGS